MSTALSYATPDEAHEDMEDEFHYGFRTVVDGESGESHQVPLTPDDFLDPEEGDHFMQGTLHELEVDRLRGIFRFHLRDREDVTVYCDLKIEWGIPGVSNPAPDVSVIRNVTDPGRPRGTFSVPDEEGRPIFVLEVVSPRYRSQDINDKPEIYRRAGVFEYIIVDPHLSGDKVAYEVTGHRLIGNRYISIHPDDRGRIYSQTTDVWIGPTESKDGVIVEDGQTGEPILPDMERADAEAGRADAEAGRADAEAKARKAAEEQANIEAKRANAEAKRANAEAKRADVEAKQAEAEAKARKVAEERADAEAKARKLADEKIAELSRRLEEITAQVQPSS